jgi:hypothetical protein
MLAQTSNKAAAFFSILDSSRSLSKTNWKHCLPGVLYIQLILGSTVVLPIIRDEWSFSQSMGFFSAMRQLSGGVVPVSTSH